MAVDVLAVDLARLPVVAGDDPDDGIFAAPQRFAEDAALLVREQRDLEAAAELRFDERTRKRLAASCCLTN